MKKQLKILVALLTLAGVLTFAAKLFRNHAGTA
jgi:hypothetical protein